MPDAEQPGARLLDFAQVGQVEDEVAQEPPMTRHSISFGDSRRSHVSSVAGGRHLDGGILDMDIYEGHTMSIVHDVPEQALDGLLEPPAVGAAIPDTHARPSQSVPGPALRLGPVAAKQGRCNADEGHASFPKDPCAEKLMQDRGASSSGRGAEKPSMGWPVAKHEPSAAVRLRSASGVEKMVVFTHRPVHVNYKCELPVVVSTVGEGGEGARAGVEVGDTLLACNGLTLEGKDMAACHRLLQEAFESLPLRVSLLLRTANCVEKLVVFTHRPVNIEYKCELPVVVSTVNADGEGARAGVEVGDTLLACNGLKFEGKDAAACHRLLQQTFESLPVRVSVQVRSAIGRKKLLAFTHRPVGINYKCQLPIVVSTVVAGGEGAKAGVEVGDTLLACNGITLEGKDAHECHLLLQEVFNSLPLQSFASI